MSERQVPKPFQRVVTFVLVLVNLIAILYAIYLGEPGERDRYFREESFISWLGAAQMLGAALLFLACYFAADIIREGRGRRDAITWLLFAVGFFVLALDQQFRLRDELTLLVEGTLPNSTRSSPTALALKAIPTGLAMALVFISRSTVLANFRMVLSFAAGFWFLICSLLVTMLFESMGADLSSAKIAAGSAKLFAVAMFLSASYAALLARMQTAQSRIQSLEDVQERTRKSQATQRRRSQNLAITQSLRKRTESQPEGSAKHDAADKKREDKPASEDKPTNEDKAVSEDEPASEDE